MKRICLIMAALLVLSIISVGVAGAEGVISKDLLVVEGYYDKIEDILTKLGFGDRIEIIPGNNTTLMNTNFDNYKALFINCDYGGVTDRPDAALLEKVKNFVHGGGMLYVTDDSANFLKNWDAEMGYNIAYDNRSFSSTVNWKTVVVDPMLRARFPVSRFDADGNILIHHAADNGEPIRDPGKANVLLRNAAINPGSGAVADEVQAIDFNPSAGGRVVYTTFHNHARGSLPVEGTENYVAYENVLTIMEYICGAMGTASEQEMLLEILRANVSNMVGNAQGGPFSDLVSNGWTFYVSGDVTSSQLTFAIYANATPTQGQTFPNFTLTAPNGETRTVYGDPRGNPVIIHVQRQTGAWTIQCTDNTYVVPDEQITTVMTLAGVFGTASPIINNGGDDGDDNTTIGCNAGLLALAALALSSFIIRKR